MLELVLVPSAPLTTPRRVASPPRPRYEEKKLKLNEAIKAASRDVKRKTKQLEKLSDRESLRLQRLRTHPDGRKAIAFLGWLANARSSGKLKGQVSV